MSWEIRQGDALERLREMPDRSVHLICTSPPYWGLRKYSVSPLMWGGEPECQHQWGEVLPAHHPGQVEQTKWKAAVAAGAGQTAGSGQGCLNCGAWRGDLGLEPTPQMFVQHLVEIFREVGRVLRDDGTLWVNLADSYNGSGKAGSNPEYQSRHTEFGKPSDKPSRFGPPTKIAGLRPKSLIGIPWRFALAMMDEGWILRRDIIWAKGVSFLPNYAGSSMPESCQDRPSTGHEYIFMFSKQERYYYDIEAVKEPAQNWGVRDRSNFRSGTEDPKLKHNGLTNASLPNRNLRSVWVINPEPTSEKHYATWPSRLAATMIKAGTSERGVCPACGAPWERVVERTPMEIRRSGRAEEMGEYGRTQPSGTMVAPPTAVTTGWQPGCTCAAGDPLPATVLDPFSGSGTTGLAVLKLGRSYIGLELSPEYVAISERRLRQIDAYQPSLI